MSVHGTGSLTVKPQAGKLKRDTETFGSMDPYCKVKLGSQEQKTHTHNGGGKHPSWNQSLSFRRNQEHLIQIEVWEKDAISADDLIGETSIALQPIFDKKNSQEWYTLNYKGKDAGQILVAFEWFPDNKGMTGQQMPYGQMPMQYPQQPIYPQPQQIPTTFPMAMPYQNQMPPQQGYYPPQQPFQQPPPVMPQQPYQQPYNAYPPQQQPPVQPYPNQMPPQQGYYPPQQPYQQPPVQQYPPQQQGYPQQYPPQQQGYPPQQQGYPPQQGQYPPPQQGQYPPQQGYKPY